MTKDMEEQKGADFLDFRHYMETENDKTGEFASENIDRLNEQSNAENGPGSVSFAHKIGNEIQEFQFNQRMHGPEEARKAFNSFLQNNKDRFGSVEPELMDKLQKDAEKFGLTLHIGDDANA